MDQIFTEVEMTTLEKVINETWVTPVSPPGHSLGDWPLWAAQGAQGLGTRQRAEDASL